MATMSAVGSSSQRQDVDVKSQPFIGQPVPLNPTNVRRYTVPNVSSSTEIKQTSRLPPGWIEMKDPNGQKMFYNSANGQTSWQRPIIRTLPPGWRKAISPDGKQLYVHAETGSVSYESPSQGQKIADPATDTITSAASPKSQISRKPMNRAATEPAAKSESMLHVHVNLDTIKTVPGIEQALAVHQISTNNNTKVLSKQLATDMSQTTVALKDTTITAASLATRQVKVVGKTMMSPKKMQKVSKRMVVQTGAMTLQAARACKLLGKDMVDAADKQGKYQPKQQRPFVPYDPNASVDLEQQGITITTSSRPCQAAKIKPQAGIRVSANASANLSVNAVVPARKPVRKSIQRPAHEGSTSINVHSSDIATTDSMTSANTSYMLEKPSLQTVTKFEATHDIVSQLEALLYTQSTANLSQEMMTDTAGQQPGYGGLQVYLQGVLKGSASMETTLNEHDQSQSLAMDKKPDMQTESPTAGPPPTYDQVVRPLRTTTARPVQKLPRPARPQSDQQPQQSQHGSSHGADMQKLTEMINLLSSIHIRNQQTIGSGSSEPRPTDSKPHQGHQQQQVRPKDCTPRSSKPHLQHRSPYPRQSHQRHSQVHSRNEQEFDSQNQIAYSRSPSQQAQTAKTGQEPAYRDGDTTCPDTTFEQPALHHQNQLSTADSTEYSQQAGTYEVYAQETMVLASDESLGAYDEDEVYFAGEDDALADQEIVYCEGDNEVSYEEAAINEDDADLCEEEYDEVDGGEEEYGIEEEFECEP